MHRNALSVGSAQMRLVHELQDLWDVNEKSAAGLTLANTRSLLTTAAHNPNVPSEVKMLLTEGQIA